MSILKIIGLYVILLFLMIVHPALAERRLDPRALWSTEFLPEDQTQESYNGFIWGISYGGSAPKEVESERFFSLASVKKIITAATALRELGSQFRFNNEFSGSFDSEHKVLLKPAFAVSGDPTWGHAAYGETLTTRISKVIQELKKIGVTKVAGTISIHSLKPSVTQFERPGLWKKSWEMQCYAALPVPVSLNGNCAELVILSNRKIYWNTPGVSTPVENQLQFSRNQPLQIRPVFDSLGRVKKYIVVGGISTSVVVALPVHQNEEWLKNLFVMELKRSGIAYESFTTEPIRAGEPFHVDLSSLPLKEILIPFLQESINLVGERLHIEAPGDFITLASLIPDPREYEKVTLVDGSGLIAENRITPKAMSLFLKGLPQQLYFQDLFDGLPVSGVSGTLQNRMTDPLLKNRIHAKTGTISGVSNLAGYWVKSDRSLEPFVIFTESGVTAQTARARIDLQVAEFARKN